MESDPDGIWNGLLNQLNPHGFGDRYLRFPKCLGDGIGIHIGLRNQVLGVRLPSEAPIFAPIVEIGKTKSW